MVRMEPEAYDSRARVAALLAGLKDEGILPASSGAERRSGEATPVPLRSGGIL